MKIVKKPAPQFYDCICPKCKAEFMYQLDDVVEVENEVPEGCGEMVAAIMPPIGSYVTCPCCNNKIVVYGGIIGGNI